MLESLMHDVIQTGVFKRTSANKLTAHRPFKIGQTRIKSHPLFEHASYHGYF